VIQFEFFFFGYIQFEFESTIYSLLLNGLYIDGLRELSLKQQL